MVGACANPPRNQTNPKEKEKEKKKEKSAPRKKKIVDRGERFSGDAFPSVLSLGKHKGRASEREGDRDRMNPLGIKIQSVSFCAFFGIKD